MPEMNENTEKPTWEIDRVLQSLVGAQIRVGAEAFAPFAQGRVIQEHLTPASQLILPDNTPVDGQPVFFEGRLEQFNRQIGLVRVQLGPAERFGAQGMILFRERSVVILPGPAVVQLSVPFHIERLPTGEENYWRDLRLPCAQLLFNFQD